MIGWGSLKQGTKSRPMAGWKVPHPTLPADHGIRPLQPVRPIVPERLRLNFEWLSIPQASNRKEIFFALESSSTHNDLRWAGSREAQKSRHLQVSLSPTRLTSYRSHDSTGAQHLRMCRDGVVLERLGRHRNSGPVIDISGPRIQRRPGKHIMLDVLVIQETWTGLVQ